MVRRAMSHMKAAISLAMAVVTTVDFLPCWLSLRYRAVRRVCLPGNVLNLSRLVLKEVGLPRSRARWQSTGPVSRPRRSVALCSACSIS